LENRVDYATSKQGEDPLPASSIRRPAGPLPGHDILVIGASAGGVEALSRLVELLPADLPAATFVVLHMAAGSTSALPAILDRAGPLHRGEIEDGTTIEHGRLYVAPPGRHLLLDRGSVRLGGGPREHGHRPAIDPLFRTAAASYGPRAVGVLLSGTLDDGIAGLAVLKRRGGTTLVQDPAEALFPSMPETAIQKVRVDHVLPVARLAEKLTQLAVTPIPAADERSAGHAKVDAAEAHGPALGAAQHETPGLALTCPECGAALTEREGSDGIVRFSCRVGHAFSEESLIPQQSDALESALWAAVRGLEERAHLLGNIAARLRARGMSAAAERYQDQARDSLVRARVVRRAVLASAIEDLDAADAADRWPAP
jgi:two-component system, chemotaxis family, protein-glutamate methylesterase/glutaminase